MNKAFPFKPCLLVTIDTEPDDQWARPSDTTTENCLQIPRIQELFDRYGVRPTYFVEYIVSCDVRARKALLETFEDGRCEIGSHLHGWSTPPEDKLDRMRERSNPYISQYPPEIQRSKFLFLHKHLTEVFGTAPKSHRAGKYGLDLNGVKLLREHGYLADSSLTPMINWQSDLVAGPDFRNAPQQVYELSEEDVCSPGKSGIIEIPVSIGYTRVLPEFIHKWLCRCGQHKLLPRFFNRLICNRRRWYRPLVDVPTEEYEWLGAYLIERNGFINMMFHSSELIPNSQGCSDNNDIKELFHKIEQMIIIAKDLGCRTNLTVSDFAAEVKSLCR